MLHKRFIRTSFRTLRSIVLILVMIPIYACSLTKVVPELPVLMPGAPAPEFTLNTVEGPKVRLNQLRGKVIVISFWSTWCSDCVIQMKALQTLHEQYQEQGLIVLGVNCEDANSKIMDFAQQHHLSFPLLVDPLHTVADLYQVNAYPTTLIVDTQGVLLSILPELILATNLEEQVSTLLKQPTDRFFSLAENVSAAAALPLPAPVTPTSLPTIIPTLANKNLEGCVNARGLKARNGSDVNAQVLLWLNEGECYIFDGRNGDGTWLRLMDDWTWRGQRLWVRAAYVILQGDPLTLPLVP